MTGKISDDADKPSLDGSEKLAGAAGGSNYGILLSTIAAWLASLTQTLIGKTIDAASNTISNLTTATFAANVIDTDVALAANSNARIATQKAVKAYVVASLMQNYLSGLTLSTAGASASFSVALGQAAGDTNAAMMTLAGAYTKTTAPWAVGTGNGALDTGAIANSTWYHVWLIQRSDTGIVDVLISLSATAPTMPTSYDRKRRIGAMKTNGSAQWIKFVQNGDDFTWDAPVSDVSATNPGTAAVTRTVSVPTGVKMEAKLSVAGAGLAGDPGPGAIYISDLAIADNAPAIAAFCTLSVYTPNSGAAIGQLAAPVRVMTNTSAQIRSRCQISNANIQLNINTFGWVDRRGRDG
ncbi:hypothetical protein [Bradyrhizobium sp. SEMIA]|uniref:hypothetical protein n=1 Tax=Bradyrhizobium sp. SEMIA TaxID=2597515 RepID=UPI0018A66F21|nr:hypothetical protein [Bradyrhizobium sp. SEMIA]QOG20470.1 hypothetical protein FOM02_27060 [Bradyrhizobium sp. SEMIA]